nr:MAG TPA: hypothetical protein [Caudoviricetes sp.]
MADSHRLFFLLYIKFYFQKFFRLFLYLPFFTKASYKTGTSIITVNTA